MKKLLIKLIFTKEEREQILDSIMWRKEDFILYFRNSKTNGALYFFKAEKLTLLINKMIKLL